MTQIDSKYILCDVEYKFILCVVMFVYAKGDENEFQIFRIILREFLNFVSNRNFVRKIIQTIAGNIFYSFICIIT
jgi:hypothetical protein